MTPNRLPNRPLIVLALHRLVTYVIADLRAPAVLIVQLALVGLAIIWLAFVLGAAWRIFVSAAGL